MFSDEILSESFQGLHSFTYQTSIGGIWWMQNMIATNVLLLHYVRCKTLPTVPSSARRRVFSSPSDKQDTRGYTDTQYELSPGNQVSSSNCMHLQFWLTFFAKIQSESFQGLRSVACQNKHVRFHLYINYIVTTCTILVGTESLLEAGLKLCMCNLFDKITLIGMSNQTCQYMILNVLKLHFVNWVMETRCQDFAFANLTVNVTYYLDKILLFVFCLSLGLLTSARKKHLHVYCIQTY